MLIKYNKSLSLKSIKNICKINNIKYDSNFRKDNLLKLLNNYKSAKFIQSTFRIKLNMNDTCPISYDRIKYPFISIKTGNKFIYYDFNTFINYLNKIDEFRDPCTREDIKDKKVNEINKMIIYFYGKNTNKIVISNSMIRNADLNIITYCLYDVIKDLNTKKNTTHDFIYTNILPRIIYYASYLIKHHDKEDAKLILKAFKETVHNPLIREYISFIELCNNY